MLEWILLILLTMLITRIWIDIRKIDKRGKVRGLDFEEVKDGILEIEARVRRLEHHLLSRKQTEERDPLNFIDSKTGKPILNDELIETLKRMTKDVRKREIHKRIDPKGAEQIEKLESLHEKMYSGKNIDENEVRDAFGGSYRRNEKESDIVSEKTNDTENDSWEIPKYLKKK